MDRQKILNDFGFNFKMERMRQKLTQDDIVEKTDFSKAYISNVENGRHDLSMVNALILARVLGKTIEELIGQVCVYDGIAALLLPARNDNCHREDGHPQFLTPAIAGL